MSVEENKQVARKYHDLNPDDVEEILTPDFIGRHRPGRRDWTRDAHIKFLTEHRGLMKDTVHEQIGEGDWVATRFTRTGTYKGQQYVMHTMHFKRLEGGKIAELWEYFESEPLEE